MKKISIFISLLALFLSGCSSNETVYEISSSSDGLSSVVSQENSQRSDEAQAQTEKTGETDSAKDDEKTIYVYICGAVKNPGVYELPDGSRVFHAIEASGGLLENAEERSVNQAQVLADGQEIIVYEVGEEIPSSDNAASDPSDNGKININTADKDALMELPGIGESRADEIINYRTEHGKFDSIEDIMNISGIKEKMFEKIKDYIEV